MVMYTVQRLLKHGADMTEKDDKLETVIHAAAYKQYTGIIQNAACIAYQVLIALRMHKIKRALQHYIWRYEGNFGS